MRLLQLSTALLYTISHVIQGPFLSDFRMAWAQQVFIPQVDDPALVGQHILGPIRHPEDREMATNYVKIQIYTAYKIHICSCCIHLALLYDLEFCKCIYTMSFEFTSCLTMMHQVLVKI